MKPFIRAASLLFLAAASTLASGKDFIIYDRMDYVGKPDLTADKLSKVCREIGRASCRERV